jgi:hypothetical protein
MDIGVFHGVSFKRMQNSMEDCTLFPPKEEAAVAAFSFLICLSRPVYLCGERIVDRFFIPMWVWLHPPSGMEPVQ